MWYALAGLLAIGAVVAGVAQMFDFMGWCFILAVCVIIYAPFADNTHNTEK